MTPPFTPGQRVYQLRRPESGSLIVDRCFWVNGNWRVKALDELGYGYTPVGITAPAEYFRALPTNWTEPPRCIAESFGYDAASDVRSIELRDDPEYATRIADWCDAILARAAAMGSA